MQDDPAWEFGAGDEEDELGLLGAPIESKGEALKAVSEIDAGWGSLPRVGAVFVLVGGVHPRARITERGQINAVKNDSCCTSTMQERLSQLFRCTVGESSVCVGVD